jgi:hypothetical protein
LVIQTFEDFYDRYGKNLPPDLRLILKRFAFNACVSYLIYLVNEFEAGK